MITIAIKHNNALFKTSPRFVFYSISYRIARMNYNENQRFLLSILFKLSSKVKNIRSKITNCPKKLHADTVGTVTRPVTHTDDVAVNSASI